MFLLQLPSERPTENETPVFRRKTQLQRRKWCRWCFQRIIPSNIFERGRTRGQVQNADKLGMCWFLGFVLVQCGNLSQLMLILKKPESLEGKRINTQSTVFLAMLIPVLLDSKLCQRVQLIRVCYWNCLIVFSILDNWFLLKPLLLITNSTFNLDRTRLAWGFEMWRGGTRCHVPIQRSVLLLRVGQEHYQCCIPDGFH